MGRVNNKVALVTGGASGVGKETVELLLKEGAYVAFGDIDVQSGEALAKACGERALFLRHDVSNEVEWQQVITKVQAHFGPLDILINNAGGSRSFKDLPATAVKYISRIEELIQAQVILVSTSPEREDTILVRNPFSY